MKKRWLAFLVPLLLVAASPAIAADIVGNLTQGGLAIGHAAPGAHVLFDGKEIDVAPDGLFVFGFGRSEGPDAHLDILYPDGRAEHLVLAIVQRAYDIQHIDGLPQETVTPDPATAARIAHEQAAIKDARSDPSAVRYFLDGFTWPAVGPISGVYGSQRILNGEARQPHSGVDVAAPEGAPVMAPAAGVVRLAAPDFFLTGGTLVIDHGMGVSSVMIHLRDLAVAAGAAVARGQIIGHVGKTGRATGPHLHWGIYWHDVPLDPALLLPHIN